MVVTPLELLLAAMRDCWERGDTVAAVALAKAAAPYVHPRAAQRSIGVESVADDVLDRLCGGSAEGEGVSEEDQAES